MKNRRTFLLSLTAGLVALVVLAAPVIADELLGFISKVDVEGKKVTVTNDDGDKDIVVTEDTEIVTPKGARKVDLEKDLEKLSKGIEKAKEKNGKGIRVKVTHDGGKASRIEYQFKKKAQ
jgi:hypothetical protein